MANKLQLDGSAVNTVTHGSVAPDRTIASLGEAVEDASATRVLVENTSGSNARGNTQIVLKDKAGVILDTFDENTHSGNTVQGLVLRHVSTGTAKNVALSDSQFLVWDVTETEAAGPEFTVEVKVSGRLTDLALVSDVKNFGQEKSALSSEFLRENFTGNGQYNADISLDVSAETIIEDGSSDLDDLTPGTQIGSWAGGTISDQSGGDPFDPFQDQTWEMYAAASAEAKGGTGSAAEIRDLALTPWGDPSVPPGEYHHRYNGTWTRQMTNIGIETATDYEFSHCIKKGTNGTAGDIGTLSIGQLQSTGFLNGGIDIYVAIVQVKHTTGANWLTEMLTISPIAGVVVHASGVDTGVAVTDYINPKIRVTDDGTIELSAGSHTVNLPAFEVGFVAAILEMQFGNLEKYSTAGNKTQPSLFLDDTVFKINKTIAQT